MMRSLRFKWITTLLVASLVGVFLVGVFASQTTIFAYDRLRMEQAEDAFLEDMTVYYQEFGRWDGAQEWLMAPPPMPFPEPGVGGQKTLFRALPFMLVDTNHVVVVGDGPFQAGERVSSEAVEQGQPLFIEGQRVGTALAVQRTQPFDPREQRYIDSVNSALLMGTLGSTAVSVLIGLLLSRHFLRPLRELTDAITAMQKGNLGQQVQVRTQDELGILAQAFNRMSIELQRANQLRKQMTADIAHDLRTPLMVISGYLEAMRDGTLKPTLERFDAMNQEAVLLKRLIEDLRTLSLADAGELPLMKQVIAPRDLLEQVKESFTPIANERQISLHVEAQEALPTVSIDRERMTQVLGNLVSNALRYTDSGGTITLQGSASQQDVQMMIRDTGAGIAEDKLPNIFERSFRADESRYQHEGESGLGLAIAKAIVEAHQGTISAQSRVGVGTTMTITLPAAPLELAQN